MSLMSIGFFHSINLHATLSCFLLVKNHGVPMELIESMFGQSKLFFDLPLETKVKLPFKMPYDTGYAGFQGQLLDYSVGIQTEGDFKESFNMSAGDVLHFSWENPKWKFLAPAKREVE